MNRNDAISSEPRIRWKRDKSFCVYHDESRDDIKHDAVLFNGMLIVPFSEWTALYDALQVAREGYTGQIHFGGLRDNTFTRREEVARRWLNLYISEWSHRCYFRCNGFDKTLLASTTNRIQDLYSTRVVCTLIDNLSYSFSNLNQIYLWMYLHHRTLSRRDPIDIHTLSSALAVAASSHTLRRTKCPRVIFPDNQIAMLTNDLSKTSDPLRVHGDFMQLTDLLTGLMAHKEDWRGTQEIKHELAKTMERFELSCRFNEEGLGINFSASRYTVNDHSLLGTLLQPLSSALPGRESAYEPSKLW